MKTENDEIVTSDLSKFGSRERYEAEELLHAWREHGLPVDFYDDAVTVAMNKNSGYVFLTNSEYQVAMLSDGHLESFYNCPQCGEEGMFEDVKDHGQGSIECRRWVRDIKKGLKA